MAKKSKDETIDLLYTNTSGNYNVKIKKNKNIPNKPVSKKDMINLDDEIIIGLTPKNEKGKQESFNNKKNKKQAKKKKVKNKTQKGKKSVIAKWTSICLLIIALVILFALSPLFSIKQIKVDIKSLRTEGTSKISSKEILNLAQIPEVQNIFSLNSKDVIKKIMDSSTYVDSVTIKKELPNVININVEERIPRYVIKIANGNALIDSKGNIMEINAKALAKPEIVGYEEINENIGNKQTTKKLKLTIVELKGYNTSIESIIDYQNTKKLVADDCRKLEIVNQIYEAAKNNELLSYISGIDITDIENVKLDIERENKVAYVGDCSNANLRMLYLKTIIEKEVDKEGEIFVNGDLHTLKPKPYFREKV